MLYDFDYNVKEVREVFRIKAGEYEDKDIGVLEKIATDANIVFDVCGELDDCTAFVFWAIVK